MTKRNRVALPDSPIFAVRGEMVKWPTLRKTYLDKVKVDALERMSHGVIFLAGKYHTRLNGGAGVDSEERAVFFEHLHKVDGAHIFLLVWIGSYHGGSIFHCAWQFPQHLNWKPEPLEWAAFRTYRRVVQIMYGNDDELWDREVREFLNQHIKSNKLKL